MEFIGTLQKVGSGGLRYCLHEPRYLMVRLKPNALDLGTDDVLLASKLLEEEILGVCLGFLLGI